MALYFLRRLSGGSRRIARAGPVGRKNLEKNNKKLADSKQMF